MKSISDALGLGRVRAAPQSPHQRRVLFRNCRRGGITAATFLLCCSVVGCETTNYAPQITAMPHKEDADLRKMDEGRTLFVHRCIECHTLPVVWRYTPEDWVELVNEMSQRAALKPAERDAVIAYIVAVQSMKD